MNRRILALIALLVSAALAPHLGAATPIEGKGGKCQECHKLSLDPPPAGSGHAPFTRGDCWACHASHGEKGERVFIHEGNGLCRCHRPEGQKFASKHVKPTPNKLPCIDCHRPHTSPRPHLLAGNLHSPLQTGTCAGCHDADGGLAAGNIAATCYRCHEQAAFQGPFRHEPAAEGDCTGCHDPHAGRHAYLLTSAYPKDKYVPWTEETYALCFGCHEMEPVTAREQDAPTGFKEGGRNLHRLHTVEQALSPLGQVTRESMSCGVCHQPHASSSPHLVRQDVDGGKGVFYLKLAYTVRDGRATCETGCHRTLSYPTGSPAGSPAPSERTSRQPSATVSYYSPCLVECHGDDWDRFRKTGALHDPVKRKMCSSCHGEHGSAERLQFARDRNAACAGCHPARSKELVAGHGGMNVTGSTCLKCHDPHASASADLLRKYTHEPFASLSCWDCHEEGSGRTITRPVNEVCAGCHEEILKPARLHGAIGARRCTACHNPHDGERPRMLVAAVPDLCYGCHERRGFELSSRHSPAAEGKCLGCHDVHGRGSRSFLVREGNSLCLTCHDPARKTFQNRHSRMPVGKASCTGCHAPHSTEGRKLVRANVHRPLLDRKCVTCHKEGGALQAASVSALCFRCHDSAGFQGPSRHEPVDSGDCTGCHDPHGSRYRPLLVSEYPRERYLPYRAQSFGLCFTCHDPGAFIEDGTAANTSFKNGGTNLHYLHVVKRTVSESGTVAREGMSCRNCHLPHASLSPHLVRQEVDCGGGVQCLKLAYTVREGKGTCRGGCHKAASYATAATPQTPTP